MNWKRLFFPRTVLEWVIVGMFVASIALYIKTYRECRDHGFSRLYCAWKR